MQVKVCGITTQKQLDDLSDGSVDLIGFNFYPKSKRYVSNPLSMENCKKVKVGVFVNASFEELQKRTKEYKLDLLQLHGDENLAYCKIAKSIAPVMKVFRIGQSFDFNQVADFDFCDYFLFDTFTSEYGGSGKIFDWKVLENYQGDTPFYLSGGIGPQSIAAIKQLLHPQLIGVDVNSKFEVSPGVKDIEVLTSFIKELRN